MGTPNDSSLGRDALTNYNVRPALDRTSFAAPVAAYDIGGESDGSIIHAATAKGGFKGLHSSEGDDADNRISIPNRYVYKGAYEADGHTFHVWENDQLGEAVIKSPTAPQDAYPATWDVLPAYDSTIPAPCFMAGTEIATPTGVCVVENLAIGDPILTAFGGVIDVKWIGRSSFHPRISRNPRIEPVCICADALGNGLPHSDLTVTADHGMILDGMVIHASSLVNGSTIAFVPLADLPDRVTYYHVETEAHEVILANGAAAETFVDVLTRAAFDNYAEYIDLYGVDRMIPEMDRLRVTAHRLLTAQARQQLGIAAPAPAPETLQDAACHRPPGFAGPGGGLALAGLFCSFPIVL